MTTESWALDLAGLRDAVTADDRRTVDDAKAAIADDINEARAELAALEGYDRGALERMHSVLSDAAWARMGLIHSADRLRRTLGEATTLLDNQSYLRAVLGVADRVTAAQVAADHTMGGWGVGMRRRLAVGLGSVAAVRGLEARVREGLTALVARARRDGHVVPLDEPRPFAAPAGPVVTGYATSQTREP